MRQTLTHQGCKNAKAPARGRRVLWDETVKGLGLRITDKGAKSFFVQGRVDGRTVRAHIGRFPQIPLADAREAAKGKRRDIELGIDPADERKARKAEHERARAASVTLRQVWGEYQASRTSRGRTRKQSTIDDMQAHLDRNFADWLDRPVAEITRDGVLQRHRKIEKRGPTQADQAMRYLRALLNFARDAHTAPDGSPVLPDNPVAVLRAARRWHAPKRKRDVIPRNTIGATINALDALATADTSGPALRTEADMLLFMLYTGLRVGEASTLRWRTGSDDGDANVVDPDDWTVILPDPKNGQPTTLPLSHAAADVLDRRPGSASGCIFPNGREDGPKIDTRRARKAVADAAGKKFDNHGLRRTFISTAEGLDIGTYTLRRLINHAISDTDVTEGYITPGMERLRSAADRVADDLLERAAAAKAANVLTMPTCTCTVTDRERMENQACPVHGRTSTARA